MARRLFLIALAGCGGPSPDGAAPPICDPALSWTQVGEPFVRTWCTPCHAAGLAGPERFGAPPGLDLESHADVVAWADRIAAVAVPEHATMPPAGPAPADERLRLGAWLSCGAPGTDAAVDDARCDGPILQGDVHVVSEGRGPCPDRDRLAGDLVIDDALDDTWRCLCEVQGEVRLSTPEVSLPSLARAGAIRGAAPLQALALDALAHSDAITLQGDTLRTLSLPLLSDAGSVAIGPAASLHTLSLHRLAAVQGPLALSDLPALSDLRSLDALRTVEGDLSLHALAPADALLLRRLERVGGSLALAAHPSLRVLDGFDALASIGGDLSILDNPSLIRIDGLPGPVSIGGAIRIEGNDALPASEIDALQARTTP